MSGDYTNTERADYAQLALDAYAEAKEGRRDYDVAEGIAVDLIADILHLVAREDGDTENVIRLAKLHFESEVNA